MSVKIAIIGAGSIGFTRKLMHDILAVPELADTFFHIINQGHVTNLPDGCVIEIPGYVDRNGINMPIVGELPLACAATCAASARVQEMGMEAAVHGDVLLLKQAMLHDPLVGAVCNPAEVWQMTDEMLAAQARWLPQYRESLRETWSGD